MTTEMLLTLFINYGLPIIGTFVLARYGDKFPILAALLKLFPAGPSQPQPSPIPAPTPVPPAPVPGPGGPLPDLLSQLLALLLRVRAGTATQEETHAVQMMQTAITIPPKV